MKLAPTDIKKISIKTLNMNFIMRLRTYQYLEYIALRFHPALNLNFSFSNHIPMPKINTSSTLAKRLYCNTQKELLIFSIDFNITKISLLLKDFIVIISYITLCLNQQCIYVYTYISE